MSRQSSMHIMARPPNVIEAMLMIKGQCAVRGRARPPDGRGMVPGGSLRSGDLLGPLPHQVRKDRDHGLEVLARHRLELDAAALAVLFEGRIAGHLREGPA